MKSFEILPDTLEDGWLALNENAFVYNGSEQTPSVSMNDGIADLTENTDYTITYEDSDGNAVAEPTDVGTYRIVVSGNGNFTGVLKREFAISKAQLTVEAGDKNKTYGDDDPELTWTVTRGTVYKPLQHISIFRDSGENADDYTITVSQDEGENANYDITFVPGTFTIQKAELTVTAEDKTADYGDAVPAYTVTYSGFENGDDQDDLGGTLSFDGDYVQFADKGDYTITPKGYESGNYTFDYRSGTLTVGAKKITVTIDARSSVYGEEIVVLTAADDGIVNGDTNVYSLATNAAETSDVGKYDITGTALDDNYIITFENGEDAYEITKATAAAATEPAAAAGLTYTGAEQALISAGATGDGEMLYRLEDQSWSAAIPAAKTAGTYDVWYKVAGDKNHKDSEPVKIEAEIAKADPGIGAVTAGIVSDTLETSAIVLTRENEILEGTLAVDVGQSLVWGDNAIAYTFTPKDTANYKTVNDITAVTVRDTVAPTGTLSVSARSWTEFLNTITFGLFFKEDQTLSVEAIDNISGVARIEYYETEDVLDLDGVKALADEKWTEMRNGKVSIAAEDAKQFIYYIRITDKAGNRAYLATNGAEFDTTAPAVSGVAGGVTYYTTQVVTVTDKNLDTVTLNGEAVTGAITLEGNREATYTIAATDKAGNTTTVTVKTAAIADITGLLEEKTEDNVTSDDKANLQIIVDTVTELLKDEDLTDAEKAELEAARAGAEARLDVIEAAQDAIDTEATGKVEDVTAENVKLEDKEDLSAARTDLEKALDDNSGNYTEEEKKVVEDEIARIDEALQVIEKVEAVEKIVAELPAAVGPEDDEGVAAVDKAKEAYEELTEYERSLIDAETKEKLDRLTAAAAAYDIIQGDGSCWIKGSGDGLTFVANGAFGKFVGIEMDGKELAKANYDARSGSTIITLKASYLDTQSVGEHTITVVYTDGRTDGTFRIAANPGIPATGDDSNIMLYGSVFTVSLAALVVLRLAEKKRKREKA